jgi:hypothetical protein
MPYNWTEQEPSDREESSAEKNARRAGGRPERTIDCGADTEERDRGVTARRRSGGVPYGRQWIRNAESYGEQQQAI